ncbi:glutamate-1-semialdehyde 2,1-aminomutase [Cryptococcus neoformans c45]|nr:glutamate-1-semialdehyde 2,1-aminomutase [Cryptococcus neoformans var. grubii c45]
MKKFDAREGAISHGGTFNNSPLTMVAGATAMERILTEDALKNLNALGDWMKEEINKMFTSDESPFLMTGLGSINQFHRTLIRPKSASGSSFFLTFLREDSG